MSLLCLISCSKLLKCEKPLLTKNQYNCFFDCCKLSNVESTPQFIRIEQAPPTNINCFLQFKNIKEIYKYEYTGTIIQFNKLLTKHNIGYEYIISIAEQIYSCKLELIEFEIRIKNEEINIIQFFPVVGNITDMLNTITKN